MAALEALRDYIYANREALAAAASRDFGRRSPQETLLLEVFPLLEQIRHARRHLRRWMRRRRARSSWFLWPSRAYLIYQPLGVVGLIGAWNYPFLLTLGPLVDAIAAGNHVIVKPPERAPHCAECIKSIIAQTFPPEYVACATGDVALAIAFAGMPFDHLLFTGSASIGQQVMRAAADNLTPVTLELGGKSPAIVHPSFSLPLAVRRIMAAKLLNAGQTCLAPDYALIPEGQEHRFEQIARNACASLYPASGSGTEQTAIIDRAHVDRLEGLLADAASRGARVVPLADEVPNARAEKIVPPHLVFETSADMRITQEEIFGPVLPVITYRSLDEALERVNAAPRPLALYYFDRNRQRIKYVVDRTLSGGVTINDCVYHFAQHGLPFGGVRAERDGRLSRLHRLRNFFKEAGHHGPASFHLYEFFLPSLFPSATAESPRTIGAPLIAFAAADASIPERSK